MRIPKTKSSILYFLYTILPKVNAGFERNPLIGEEIVVLNFDSLGDNILFSAVIKSIRKSFPKARITLVVNANNQELYLDCPEIDEVKALKNLKWLGEPLKDVLRKFRIYFWLLFRFKGKVSKIIGPSWLMFENQNEVLNNFFQKICPRDLALFSEIDWKLVNSSHQVPRMVGISRIYGVKYTETHLSHWLKTKEVITTSKKKGKKIVVALGAGHPRREYGTKNLVTLIQAINSIKEFKEIFIVGLSKNIFNYEDKVESLNLETSVNNLVDKLNLGDTLNLIQNSDLCISNDSGIAHLASTVKRPTLVISSHAKNMTPLHLHSPIRYHPWGTTYLVLQPQFALTGCEQTCIANIPHCIDQIPPSEILDAVRFMTHVN